MQFVLYSKKQIQIYRNSSTPAPHTCAMRMCNAESQKGAAKGSNWKEDNS